MNDIPVFVTTSDKYLPALLPFSYLFNRYWGMDQRVIIGGFSRPSFELPSNFSFHSIGEQSAYPMSKWADGLLDLLAAYPDLHHGVILFEDFFISRPVDREAIRMLYDYAVQFRNVVKVCLTGDRLYAGGMRDYDNVSRLDLVLSDYNSQYHFSWMAGVWNLDFLRSFLERNWSVWDCELAGTPKLAAFRDNIIVVGTRQWPLRHILAYRGGDPGKLLLDGIKQCDIDSLRDLGYI